jgi:prepilin-type N-terminal cleavage/methylation domain-containing protein
MRWRSFRTQIERRSKGFTLIELAIVLVVIGIIIGAILKGADLIDSAKVKRLTQNIKELETATWTFYDKTRRFPGDCNRDGLIDYRLTSAQPALSTSTTPPTSYCTGNGNQNSPFDDLKYVGIFSPDEPNAEIARHPFDGYFVLGNDGTVNAIGVYNVPAWAARMVDISIDGNENGLSGRVRRLDAAEDWPDDKNTRVAIIYFLSSLR